MTIHPSSYVFVVNAAEPASISSGITTEPFQPVLPATVMESNLLAMDVVTDADRAKNKSPCWGGSLVDTNSSCSCSSSTVTYGKPPLSSSCRPRASSSLSGTNEFGGSSSCNTSVTVSTADITCSSCDDDDSSVLEESLEISAVDTHTSILNITEDDDDDDDDGMEEEDEDETDLQDHSTVVSCQFEEAHSTEEFPLQHHDPVTATTVVVFQEMDDDITMSKDSRCTPVEKRSCFMEILVESFIENLCFAQKSDSIDSSSQQLNCDGMIEHKITSFLGCIDLDSTMQEMHHAHCMLHQLLLCPKASAERARPHLHKTPRQRWLRVKKLQMERGRSIGDHQVRAVRSMPDVKVAMLEDDQGYDSDPDHLMVRLKPSVKPGNHRAPSPSSVAQQCLQNLQGWQDHLHPIVQESLNSVWDLTWHQPNGTPVRATTWMERGTILQNKSIMIEPRLMWKDNFSSKLHSIQLMHVCRVLPVAGLLSQHPLARPSTSWMVRTTDRRCLVFQASSSLERDMMVHLWKVTVARFATLAVLEDADLILREFFVATGQFPSPIRTFG